MTPLAAGEEFSRPRRVHLRGVPEQYVLYVGNRQPHKNVDALFRAFAEVSRELPDLHLVLCGARVSTEPARLRKLGIARRTVTLRPSDAQLPWLYHRARAFVLPSRFEGFGLPVLEAMAAGCPVAIADTPALIEVSDGAAAVFPADDVELLAQTIRDIVGDDALAKDMRERGRRRAEDFSWRRTAQATVRAYDLAREL